MRGNVCLVDLLDPLKYLKQRAALVIWRNSEISLIRYTSTKLKESEAIKIDLKFTTERFPPRGLDNALSAFFAETRILPSFNRQREWLEKCKRELLPRPYVHMFRSCVRQNGGYAVLIAIAINRHRHIPSEICTS